MVALTYETQKCVSLAELSAMTSADVLVEMMMLTSGGGGRSLEHSGIIFKFEIFQGVSILN